MKEKLQFKSNKKALSAVVTALLLIVISIVGIAIIWTSTRGMIKKQISSSESCYGINEKIELDSKSTCYEKHGNDYYVRFQVNVKDIELDQLIIAISSNSEQQGYTLTNESQTIEGLERYPDNESDLILPSTNRGFSYKAGPFEDIIDNIEISPVINEQQCGTADSMSNIESCDLLVS
jgi:hypothetical protein